MSDYKDKILMDLAICENIAMSEFDGHMIMYRGTAGWKVVFGNWWGSNISKELRRIPNGMTMGEALELAIDDNADKEGTP